MRIIGLDIGDKRIGIALSDELKITAQPLETFHVKNKGSFFQRILEIITDGEVEGIVAGLPLNMNGSEGPQVEKARELMDGLKNFLFKRNIEIKIIFWDERLSSMAAERVLIEGNVSREKRKKVIDKQAASYILQGYLDSLGPQ